MFGKMSVGVVKDRGQTQNYDQGRHHDEGIRAVKG